MLQELYLKLGLSLALGLLIGIQREYANTGTAGVRTFPLITLSGSLAALLSDKIGGWLLAGTGLVLGALLVVTHLQRSKLKSQVGGITTEVSIMLMYIIGAYLVLGSQLAAVVITGIIAVLLHFKPVLHGFVDKIGEKDLKAVMQFVLITLVILPVLPNETMGPYKVLNPREIWLMVVLIVGISLVGYFTYKLLGGKIGILLSGFLAGMISSTATTVSYARKSKDSVNITHLAVLVILAASVISYVRIIVEITVVSPTLLKSLVWPLAIQLLVFLTMTMIWFFRPRQQKEDFPEQGNPAELKNALLFAFLYALVLFVSSWAIDVFGKQSLYVVSFLSGLTNIDAITLSTARMAEDGQVLTPLAWRLILTGSLANIIFKWGIVLLLGDKNLKKTLSPLFLLSLVSGCLLIFLWE